jgi:hypothetical protein
MRDRSDSSVEQSRMAHSTTDAGAFPCKNKQAEPPKQ